VLPRHGQRCSASPAPIVPPHRILAWIFGRVGVANALLMGIVWLYVEIPFGSPAVWRMAIFFAGENGHLARVCRNPWRPLNSLACLATLLVPHWRQALSCFCFMFGSDGICALQGPSLWVLGVGLFLLVLVRQPHPMWSCRLLWLLRLTSYNVAWRSRIFLERSEVA
jgi:hypothetical protein